MKKIILFFVPVLLIPYLSNAQTKDDSLSIKQTAMNYIEGFYEGNVERMEKALHPELAKRIIRTDPQSGRQRLDQMSALTLLNITKSGGGKMIPVDQRIFEFKILDITGNNASVRTVAKGFFDYIHMAKWNGEWKIVNVLWDFVKN
ncbi:MAG: nuclear transport factor 2 family protein [Bacteroidota bacterium]